MQTQAPEWYAVHIRSRHEKVASQQMLYKGIDCFLPLRSVTSRWKDRRKVIETPVFPGYLFVNVVMPERRLDILTASSTVRVIEFGGNPVAIPQEQIKSVRQLLASDVPFESHPDVSEGETVEVVKGPLQGVIGTFIRNKSGGRLILSVKLIRQAVACEVDACDVRRVRFN